MLLEAAEARLQTTKSEAILPPTKLSIEHVIPQSWEAHWPLAGDASDDVLASRLRHLHRLGNLTLVTSALNPAMSNDPWAEKRAALVEHSVLRLNARLVHDYEDTFDEHAIQQRGEILAELLLAEWPGPAAADWMVFSMPTSPEIDDLPDARQQQLARLRRDGRRRWRCPRAQCKGSSRARTSSLPRPIPRPGISGSVRHLGSSLRWRARYALRMRGAFLVVLENVTRSCG